MKDLLTLIIPIKDRHPLTDRLLTSLNHQKCSCRIILADGSVEKTVLQAVEEVEDEIDKEIDFSVFYPHLTISYIYTGPDNSTRQFIRKMSKAHDLITTPFCMVVDNDDLVDINGVQRGVSFLCENIEYSTYQNSVLVTKISPEAGIKIEEPLYTKKSIDQDVAFHRLCSCIENFNSFNYAIFRTQISQCFFKILDVFNIHNFQIFQKGWAYFASLLGMCERRSDESYYYFIPGNSILQNSSMFHKFSQWHEYSDPVIESCYMISIISSAYKYIYGSDVKEAFAEKFMNEVFDKCGLSGAEEYKKSIMSEIKKNPIYKTENKALYSLLRLYNFDYEKRWCKKPPSISSRFFIERFLINK